MALEFMRATITSGEEGSFRAIASAADSIANGERGPTRFASSAFIESLERSTRYPLLWQHKDDQPVGVAHLAMGEVGLVLDGQLALEVQRAREARELMKLGALDGVSIGFTAEKARMETHGGKSVRVVEKAKLMEVSLVTFPADPNARVMSVHKEAEADLTDEEEAAVGAEILAMTTGLMERHVGRTFSESNLTKLRAALGTLVDLVEKVDPGHIAALGRRAAKSLKHSILLVSKPKAAKLSSTLRLERLRRLEMQAAGIDVPLLKTERPPYPSYDGKVQLEEALMNALSGALSFPEEARKLLFMESVKQYLVLAEGAEEADENEDEMAASEDGGSREQHIHDPSVAEDGDGFKVVDSDGKVYGKHVTKAEAEAQVRALRAATGKE